MDKVQQKNKNFYNKNAKIWSGRKTDSFVHEVPFRKFSTYFKERAHILDIGCANGIHIPLFLGIGRKLRYEGMDISASLLRIAKLRYPQFSFIEANILDKKQLPKKKYDGFWAGSVLQHIPEADWERLITHIAYMAKPGAVGYFNLPEDRPSPASRTDQRHFTLFTPQKLKKLIAPYGWKILDSGKIITKTRTVTWHWFIVRLTM